MYEIPGYPDYYFDEFESLIFKPKQSQQKLVYKRYKIKDANGRWQWKSRKGLLALAGLGLPIPETAAKIPNTDYYYIDKSGNVYSYGPNNPQGLVLKPATARNGYLVVNVIGTNGVRRFKGVHSLMAETFIMPNYSKKGLVCMHLDNNKQNNSLDNLKVGTYSENNKQAYTDGINPGNGLKKANTDGIV